MKTLFWPSPGGFLSGALALPFENFRNPKGVKIQIFPGDKPGIVWVPATPRPRKSLYRVQVNGTGQRPARNMPPPLGLTFSRLAPGQTTGQVCLTETWFKF